ncbi:hypothetical protein BC827DRAFT_1378584, partial [Russula dissimulans]
MLKLPTHSQKPSRAPHAVLDGDIQWEDDDGDDHPSGGDGKRPLTTCQAILASVVGSSHKRLEDEKAEVINCLLTKNVEREICTTSSPVSKIIHWPLTQATLHLRNARLMRKRVAMWSRRPHQRAPEADEDARMVA